jgi:hypothetical protein
MPTTTVFSVDDLLDQILRLRDALSTGLIEQGQYDRITAKLSARINELSQ